MNFLRFQIICCHVTNSRDNIERLPLMKTVIQSKATRLKSETLMLELILSSFFTNVNNEISLN